MNTTNDIEKNLRERSESSCELCGSKLNLQIYDVPPYTTSDTEHSILTCNTCVTQINAHGKMDSNHWRCLNTSMWSTVPAVQVVVWRLLHALRHEGWPQDLIDMLYLDESTLTWAQQYVEETPTENAIVHKDSNGTVLSAGDTVTLIKDLDVKGAGFTAKRGTAVRGISLVEGNSNQIEGKVNGQQIVILTQYVKRSN